MDLRKFLKMINFFLLLTLLYAPLRADNCPDEFSPKLFSETSDEFNELLEKSFKKVQLFGSAESYKILNFKKEKDGFWYKHKSYLVDGDYKYPVVDGLWAYHINEKSAKIDQVKIAITYMYKMGIRDFSDEISSEYGSFWYDWEGDSNEFILSPDNVKIVLQNHYMSLSVQLYGTANYSTKTPFSIVNFWLYDYNEEVEAFTKCK